MNIVETVKKLSEISFDLFQNQEEIIVVDIDGKEIKEIYLSGNRVIMEVKEIEEN